MNYHERMLEDIRHLVFGVISERYSNTQHPLHVEIGMRYGRKFYVPKDETLGKGARRFNNKAKEAGLLAVTDLDTLADEDLYNLFCWVMQRYAQQM